MCCNEGCEPDPGCCCAGDLPLRGLINPAILAILKGGDAHGGEIHQNLRRRYGISTSRPIVYTLLRRMECDGLVTSRWDTQSNGPAKRVYRITEEGLGYLEDSIDGLRKVSTIIDSLLKA